MNDQEAAVLAAAQTEVDQAGAIVAALRAEKNALVASLKSVNDRILVALSSWDAVRLVHKELEQEYRVGYYGAAPPDAPTTTIGSGGDS